MNEVAKQIRPKFIEQDFRKSSYSDPGTQCVRVARRDDWVEIRDDKTAFGSPEDHRLAFRAANFDAFIAALSQARGR